jgi:predicted secreted protein with PEFG-CTERM motif
MFYGISTLIAMLLLSFAIFNSNLIGIAFAQNISDANTFDLTIDDQKYPLMYNITGGEVSSITADRAQSTLLINIASREDGTLTIELPRNVIDSKAQGNTDEEYAVFVDDQPNNFEETTNNNEARVLEIGFDNGAEQIEIAGTQIAAIDTTGATATDADNATTTITTEGDTTTITTEGDTTTITTGGPTVTTEDNATGATATEADNATGATVPRTVTGSNTFDLTIDDQTYPLMYNITGGEVSSITADRAQSTLLINIASREDGTLTIELPRNVIDSKAQGNTDEEYAVFVDDQPNNFEETTNNNEARVLEIGFDNGAEQIEIAGTQIIPEFGPISAMILAISIIGLILAATKYNKLSFIPKH